MANIKIGALGGLGENGKNMTIVEVDSRIFILDCGLKYPEIDMYGVDAVVPDMSYLLENVNRIEGIFISHGHDDHIGALPYLLEKINVPVFGTHFTICLIEDLLTERDMNIRKYRLYRINENKVLTFVNSTVSFFNISHSIPEAVGISLNTPDGSIVYVTDFSFVVSNAFKFKTSFDKITEIGKNGVLVALPESVGTNSIGKTSDDTLLEHNLKRTLRRENRVIITAFSSDLARIQKVIDLSIANNRRVAIIGRRAQNIINIAINSNYLHIPKEKLVNAEDIKDEDPNKDLVIIVTGDKSQPFSHITRMAQGLERNLSIKQDDIVVIMTPPVPGTIKHATEVLNSLYERDIDVTMYDKTTLRSSHAREDDLKLLYHMLKPKYIIPIKGEYRHLHKHYEIALSAGFNSENIKILENGEFLHINNKKIEEVEIIETQDVIIDGNFKNINISVIKERENIATEGIILINLCVDLNKKEIKLNPEVYSKGFVNKDFDLLHSSIIELATKITTGHFLKPIISIESLKTGISEEVSKLIFRFTKKRPVVLVSIGELLKETPKENPIHRKKSFNKNNKQKKQNNTNNQKEVK